MSRMLFEDFGNDAAAGEASAADLLDQHASQEEHRVEAFEQGYRAGWDDANKSALDDQERIAADLEKNLQDLGFTYVEVKSKMTRSIEGLLKELVNAVFPSLLGELLKAQVVQEVMAIAEKKLEVPVEIFVAPANLTAVEALIPPNLAFPVDVVEEPTLGDGQAHIKVGLQEQQIDLDAVLSSASRSIDGFFELQEDHRAHG